MDGLEKLSYGRNCSKADPGKQIAGEPSRSNFNHSHRAGNLNVSPASNSSGSISQALMSCNRSPKTNPASEFLTGQMLQNSKRRPPNSLIADLTSRLNLNSSLGGLVAIEQPVLVGTMQKIEKPYIRLSKTPNPSEVRPPAVLQKALNHVIQRWKEGGNYSWVCNQFRSIRQDLVVQRIHSDLTVKIYEANADVALEADDRLEFNQCLSQLKALYSAGVLSPRHLEFTAYRILYHISVEDLQELTLLILSVKSSERKDPFIRFALKAYEAWSLHNYRNLIDLACNSKIEQDKGCQRLLSWSLDREREYALRVIFKSYRPMLSLGYIAKILGFTDALSCVDFITKKLGIDSDLLRTDDKVDCKKVWSQVLRSGINS
ncbi:hypothetical protein Aperf_G00000056176 [Anoplocephala perfoliata]